MSKIQLSSQKDGRLQVIDCCRPGAVIFLRLQRYTFLARIIMNNRQTFLKIALIFQNTYLEVGFGNKNIFETLIFDEKRLLKNPVA